MPCFRLPEKFRDEGHIIFLLDYEKFILTTLQGQHINRSGYGYTIESWER